MEDRLPFLVISATFLLLGIIIVSVPMLQDKSETKTFTTTSNIIFRYGVSGAEHLNELNTIKGIFIKDMVNKEPVWTKLDFTQEEMDAIYEMMVKIDFFSYPTGFKPTIKSGTVVTQTPFMVYYLDFQNKSCTKRVYWNDQYINTGDAQHQNLNQLARLILFTIKAKPEYEKLPKPTAGYF